MPKITSFLLITICLTCCEFKKAHISHDKSVKKVQYPFFAQIHIGTGFKSNVTTCGATLIHPQWILTAAHCLPEGHPETVTVYMGTNDATHSSSDHAKANHIWKVIRHPDYIYQRNQTHIIKISHDVAVCQLHKPYTLVKNIIETIQLPLYNNSLRCKNGEVVGVGMRKLPNVTHIFPGDHLGHTKTNSIDIKNAYKMYPSALTNRTTVFFIVITKPQEHFLPVDFGVPYLCPEVHNGEMVQYGIMSSHKVIVEKTGPMIIAEFEDVRQYLGFISKNVPQIGKGRRKKPSGKSDGYYFNPSGVLFLFSSFILTLL